MRTVENRSQNHTLQAVAPAKMHLKGGGKASHPLVDDRPGAIAQRRRQAMADNSPQVKRMAQLQAMVDRQTRSAPVPRPRTRPLSGAGGGVIQRVTTMTVTNTTDNYSSGWVQAETRSTGVDSGPQREAQDVAALAGGSWVGGHMINDRLGGSGGFSNIVPITSSMNGQHRTVENAAQRVVGNGNGPNEVRYRMNILNRTDYTITPNNDVINNLPDQFQQHYDYRTKEVQAGGTQSRPIPYQAAGPITTVNGQVLNMAV
ncbi:MAG: hypothetical protein AAGN35_27505 [Bacteroidota bacterium]